MFLSWTPRHLAPHRFHAEVLLKPRPPLRRLMASKGSRDSVAVGWPGKLKTATQMLALQVLLLGTACADGAAQGRAIMRAGLGLLYASALLTVVSGAQLVRQAVRCLGAAE